MHSQEGLVLFSSSRTTYWPDIRMFDVQDGIIAKTKRHICQLDQCQGLAKNTLLTYQLMTNISAGTLLDNEELHLEHFFWIFKIFYWTIETSLFHDLRSWHTIWQASSATSKSFKLGYLACFMTIIIDYISFKIVSFVQSAAFSIIDWILNYQHHCLVLTIVTHLFPLDQWPKICCTVAPLMVTCERRDSTQHSSLGLCLEQHRSFP